MADSALGALRRHLGYLMSANVVLALASEKVEGTVKEDMAAKLLRIQRPQGGEVEEVTPLIEEGTGLPDLVDEAFRVPFQLPKLDAERWLKSPASPWSSESEYVGSRDCRRPASNERCGRKGHRAVTGLPGDNQRRAAAAVAPTSCRTPPQDDN